MEKIVIFGAGKIGRSFIGQLFGRGGYEVVFVDVFKPVIDALNQQRTYKVIIKDLSETVLNVPNVRGVLASNEETVVNEVAEASILAVSVGSNVLPKIAPVIAKGLMKRYKLFGDSPLDIILAENMRDAASFFEKQLSHYFPTNSNFQKLVGLVETSIGKMVPIMREKDVEDDILQVFAEEYNHLILDAKAFKSSIPQIDGLVPKQNIKAWVDRKLFIHNLGHATTAYLSFVMEPSAEHIHQALANEQIYNEVRQTMLQSAQILLKVYPNDFTLEDLTIHIDDLLTRFGNKFLGDTVFRVGCDLSRKLGSQDRLAGAIRLALKNNLPYDKILKAYVCGCYFRAIDGAGNLFPGDEEFSKLYANGATEILEKVGGFSLRKHAALFEMAASFDCNK